jgi:hypothetical protein
MHRVSAGKFPQHGTRATFGPDEVSYVTADCRERPHLSLPHLTGRQTAGKPLRQGGAQTSGKATLWARGSSLSTRRDCGRFLGHTSGDTSSGDKGPGGMDRVGSGRGLGGGRQISAECQKLPCLLEWAIHWYASGHCIWGMLPARRLGRGFIRGTHPAVWN